MNTKIYNEIIAVSNQGAFELSKATASTGGLLVWVLVRHYLLPKGPMAGHKTKEKTHAAGYR
ncbi:MAG: hypothetical protein LBV08_00635 [Clostridiales bacterium]|nr:hypothetical protein [Clostridiales bacterium]